MMRKYSTIRKIGKEEPESYIRRNTFNGEIGTIPILTTFSDHIVAYKTSLEDIVE